MDDLNLVLLVEDDPQDVIIVRRFLNRARRRRFSVSHVTRLEDLPDALQVSVPDVLLVDLTLPDASGLEMVQAATRFAPDTPLIVLTGVEDEGLGLQAMQYGAQDYLVKGECDARELERAIVYAIERKRLIRQIEHAAMYDALTGLPNRSLLLDRLRLAVARSVRDGASVHVVWLDIDGFKTVNSELGHAAGDVLLSQFGQRLQERVDPSDTVARIGGDEFVCVLEGDADARTRTPMLQALIQRICAPYRLFTPEQPGGRTVELAVSAGVSVFPQDASNADALLITADQAMFAAKQDGGARLTWFAEIDAERLPPDTADWRR